MHTHTTYPPTHSTHSTHTIPHTPSTSTHPYQHPPSHTLSSVEPNYDAKKVKAFSFCIQGYGFVVAPANDGRRRLSAEQVERELAPVEYVKNMQPRPILDCTVRKKRRQFSPFSDLFLSLCTSSYIHVILKNVFSRCVLHRIFLTNTDS